MGYVRNMKTRGRGFEARWYDPSDLDANGKPKQKSKTFRTHADAKAWLRAIDSATPHDRKEKDEARKRAATPFSTVAEEWYETTTALKPKTRRGYRGILNTHLLPGFGSQPVGGIDAGSIDLFLARLPIASATKRNVLRVFNLVMGHAVKRRMLTSNPVTSAKKPTVPTTDMLFLTAAQVRDLADAIAPEYRTLIYTAAYTGMRAGEIVALRVGRINFLRREVAVLESVADVGGHLLPGRPKNGKTRKVSIPPFLADMLSVEVAGKDRDALVFPAPVGGGYLRHSNMYARHFKPTVRRLVASEDYSTWTANDPDMSALRFHDLRHSSVALMIAAKAHPKVIAKQLGHSSISITMDRYGHLYDDADEAMGANLDAMFTAAETVTKLTGQVVAL